MKTVLGLALRDMWREPAHVACIILLIAGVLAPLLMLVSVKDGVMQTLIGSLRDNPTMRRIDIVGNHGFGEEELKELRSWPEIAFVVPEERSIARRIQLRAEGARAPLRTVLVSSGPGDPLLPEGMELQAGQIAISSSLAQRFQIEVGAVLSAHATRGDPPTARMRTEFEVVHITPRGWLQGIAALAPSSFVSEIEAFFDDYALPHYEVPDGRPISERAERYESFRVYAADIREVEALEGKLESYLAVIVRSRVGDIKPLLALDRNIGRALNILAICGALGLGAALLALFWANVERKRVILSMLALMGARPRALAAFPIIQAVIYAIGGIIASAILFFAGTIAFNIMFSDALAQLGGGAIVIGDPGVILAMIGGLVLIAICASAAAAYRASGTDPAIVIRGGG